MVASEIFFCVSF